MYTKWSHKWYPALHLENHSYIKCVCVCVCVCMCVCVCEFVTVHKKTRDSGHFWQRKVNWLEKRGDAEQYAKIRVHLPLVVSRQHPLGVLHKYFTYLQVENESEVQKSAALSLNVEFFQASVLYQNEQEHNMTPILVCYSQNCWLKKIMLFEREVTQAFLTQRMIMHLIKFTLDTDTDRFR